MSWMLAGGLERGAGVCSRVERQRSSAAKIVAEPPYCSAALLLFRSLPPAPPAGLEPATRGLGNRCVADAMRNVALES
jgi:hypothetical protein